jgi:hypothetical protein
MLKSLLLDRMKRKLSSGPATANQEDGGGGGGKKPAYSPSPLQPPPSPVQAAAARLASPMPEALPGPQDILRKRLLGWVDPPAPTAAVVIPPQSDLATEKSRSRSQQSATATTNTVQQQVVVAVQQEGGDPRSGGEMGWSDLPSSQPTQHLSHLENKMAPLDHHVDKGGDANLNHLEMGSKISVSYAHTSVLKHLLYRYTSMGQ